MIFVFKMSLNKYMSVFTTFSVFAAFLSIIWEAFLSLKKLNKVTTILTGLLAIESSLKRQLSETNPKVAIGYGACTDLLISATEFLNFTDEVIKDFGSEFTVDEINDHYELLQTFGYYFKNGAAAERNMPNRTLFKELLKIAKTQHYDKIQWTIGGNAPLMGIRFQMEGADVLLGARMSNKLRRLVPPQIKIAGQQTEEDDIHIILEYKAGDNWGPLTTPRANRYIVHSDQNNPLLNSIEDFDVELRKFEPHLFVVSGLQMMDSHKYKPGVRELRLEKVKNQIISLPNTLKHFEMASYVEIELLQLLRRNVLLYVDSIGMNEQELENLRQVLENDRTTLATDWNPRVATTLDNMRKVFQILAGDYSRNSSGINSNRRPLTRIHVHTLAYQALMMVKNTKWQNTKIAAAKAALTAHRYVCQNSIINPEAASLILDDSFATSTQNSAKRIQFDPVNPVPCWNEVIEVNKSNSFEVEICVAPVLVCRLAKKTAGAGDNISAAGLSQQI